MRTVSTPLPQQIGPEYASPRAFHRATNETTDPLGIPFPWTYLYAGTTQAPLDLMSKAHGAIGYAAIGLTHRHQVRSCPRVY